MKITGICPLSESFAKPGEIRVILRDKSKLLRERQEESRGEGDSRDRDK